MGLYWCTHDVLSFSILQSSVALRHEEYLREHRWLGNESLMSQVIDKGRDPELKILRDLKIELQTGSLSILEAKRVSK